MPCEMLGSMADGCIAVGSVFQFGARIKGSEGGKSHLTLLSNKFSYLNKLIGAILMSHQFL